MVPRDSKSDWPLDNSIPDHGWLCHSPDALAFQVVIAWVTLHQPFADKSDSDFVGIEDQIHTVQPLDYCCPEFGGTVAVVVVVFFAVNGPLGHIFVPCLGLAGVGVYPWGLLMK